MSISASAAESYVIADFPEGGSPAPEPDFAHARRLAGDVRALLAADLGPPSSKGFYPCIFHEDWNPSLKAYPDGYICFQCGRRGSALDWAMNRHNLTLVEAAERFDPDFAAAMQAWRAGLPIPESVNRPDPPAEPVAPPPPAWHDPEWQRLVTEIVDHCQAILWSPWGVAALDWLRARGLEDETIRRFRLGFAPAESRTKECLGCLPDRDGQPSPLWVARGITIPWAAPGSWYGRGRDSEGIEPARRWVCVNIRRLAENVFADLPEGLDKCRTIRGSSRGFLYPFPDILPTQGELPMLLVEGEFDALIGVQELGPACQVGTVGPASIRSFRKPTLAALARCPWLLLAMDHDDAGIQAARAWRERLPHKARRVLLPHGGDLNEFFVGGGDPSMWLQDELRRLGIGWTNPRPPAPRPRAPLPEKPYSDLLASLNARCVRIDGSIARPRIEVGTITGRITYREPAVQTMSKADRLSRLTPIVEGRVVVRADYGQIEPRILLAILRRRGLIAWDAGEDLYRDLIGNCSVSRETAKVIVNKAINGGRLEIVAAGKLGEFVEATGRYRDEIAAGARRSGFVETIAGRRVYLDPDEQNHRGKAVNRVVQGTAADVFNRAAERIDRAIASEGSPAAVMLVLYDEVWVECDPSGTSKVREMVRSCMYESAAGWEFEIPVLFGGDTDPTG